jgi:membrane protein implicated in regulation of membrane protease activity
MVAFALLSVILLTGFRRPILGLLQADTAPVDSLVGEVAVTLDAIEPGSVGRAELRGSTWSARNQHDAQLTRGQRCRVARVDGLMLFLVPEA